MSDSIDRKSAINAAIEAADDWDGGIGFDYIRDIQYCPVCGRKLCRGDSE